MLLGRDQWLALIMSGEPDPVMAATQWIPTLTQMVMGVLLPLLLALSAVVLDSCLRHGRAVLGMLAALALHLLGFALGLAGRLVRWIAALVAVIYGLLIFVPVKLEALVRQKANGRGLKLEG